MEKHSLIFRSIAVFIILYQFRLIAGELSDTAVFAATVFAAFGVAVCLACLKMKGKKINPFAAVIIIGLIPWAVRVFIAMPRLFIPDRADVVAVTLDSFLLNYDRNNFVSLLPFYWAALTTWFSIRSRKFLRAAVIADAVLLIIFFSIARASDIAMYRWPVVMVFLFAGIVFMQALALLFSLPPEINLQKKEKITAIISLMILAFLGGFLFLKPAQVRATEKGGGLLEPKFFSFDFSQILRLEPEISMNDDLVMIVKKDTFDHNIFLRRSVMSGYGKRRGFYRIDDLDEKNHPQRLPAGKTVLSPPDFKLSNRITQEYFMVNFDSTAFIGMKEPAEIIPYENWDTSSFKSAYAVESMASDAFPEDLLDSVIDENGFVFWPGPDTLGLSEKEFALYTEYGEDEKIRIFSEEVTSDFDNYAEKVLAVFDLLKNGEYSYSLRPGIAPDGDQLAWFLFQSKKGYCSYYAFAMTLMLRSIGIPARVAAGFFIDPGMSAFGYYPVRSDMAHAWVEVLFPGYGWIEFDPTTENLAADEEFNFSSGVDPFLFERLMREILENRWKLREKTGQDAKDAFSNPLSLIRTTVEAAKHILPPLLLISAIIVFVLIRCGFLLLSVIRKSTRTKALMLWKHAKQRLRLAGLGRPPAIQESEWASSCDKIIGGTYSLYQNAAAARFAPEYFHDDLETMKNEYRQFSSSYRKNTGLGRRLLAWILPPLALVLKTKPGKGLKFILLLLLVFLAGPEAQDNETNPFSEADELYHNAIDAEFSEFWERAIELYNEGSARFPDDFRFPRSLGNLYYNRSFYNLAWEQFRKAEMINPYSTSLLYRMADTAARLNRDTTSVAYYEKLLAIDPDDRDAIGSLGWMYYKVHRLNDGERLLHSAIERFGDDAETSMTLGTIYATMYHYEDSKHRYKESITLAEPRRDFVSVAYYNLSILETRFYKYELAMEAANASLDSQIRASGYLSRADSYIRRLDLEKAQADYDAAREIDPSPLAKLNLAQTYMISGRLEEALLYALNCLRAGDFAWMSNYGIDPVRYKRDIYEILYKTYSGLAKAEKFIPRYTLREKFDLMIKSISNNFYSTVFRKLFQKYSLAAGDAYSAELKRVNINAGNNINGGNARGLLPLDQFIQYYHSFETYPHRAVTYLNKARDLEVVIIPESEPSYDLEEGILFNDIELLKNALDSLDQVWERELISKCYSKFAQAGFPVFSSRVRAARRNAAEKLFALNRGALLQAGISLPAEVQINFTGSGADTRRSEKTLRNVLSKAGFSPASGSVAGSVRYRLDITITGSSGAGFSAQCVLLDTEGEVPPLSRAFPMRSLSRHDIYGFTGALGRFVFRVE